MRAAIPQYAELRCVSAFSFLHGASRPEELVERAKELGYEALAITDECSMAGVVRARGGQAGRAAVDPGQPVPPERAELSGMGRDRKPITDYTTNALLAERWSDAGHDVVELALVPPTIPIPDSTPVDVAGLNPGEQMHSPTPDFSNACTTCGACCAYSYDWPEFSDEDDLDGVPEAMCDCEAGRMKCDGDRCVALEGQIGQIVRCIVYEGRPSVCRDFEVATAECNAVRLHFGLVALTHQRPNEEDNLVARAHELVAKN